MANNIMNALLIMIVGIVVLGAGSVILTGSTVSDYYNNVALLDANANVSDLYILFLTFLPWAIVLGVFGSLMAVGLQQLGILGKLG